MPASGRSVRAIWLRRASFLTKFVRPPVGATVARILLDATPWPVAAL